MAMAEEDVKQAMDVDIAAPRPSGSGSSSAIDASPTTLTSIMASSGTVGSVTVSLHPLVIMNISEHWTRTKAQSGTQQKVYGALIGKQKGRNIEVMNSFELDFGIFDDKVLINRDYYNTKEEQFKQVFSDMDFLGWYSTGDMPSESDIHVHKQICEIHESPLFLLMNPGARHADLPLSLFESIIDIVNGETRMLFVKLTFTLATEEAERIGLDHVARISGASDTSRESKVSEHLMVQHSAIKMLSSRLSIIRDYVKAVESGELQYNHDILRDAKALADRLPVLEPDRFQPEFYTQYNDVALMTLLGTVQKSGDHLTHFVNRFNVLYSRQGVGGRRVRGIFF